MDEQYKTINLNKQDSALVVDALRWIYLNDIFRTSPQRDTLERLARHIDSLPLRPGEAVTLAGVTTPAPAARH